METVILNPLDFLRSILPDHYSCEQRQGYVKCFSSIGISDGNNNEDVERWSYIFNAIKSHFGEQFQEVYHNTCHCHISFNVYYSE